MPKVTRLDSNLTERAKERERAKQIERLAWDDKANMKDILKNVVERLEAIERILGLQR